MQYRPFVSQSTPQNLFRRGDEDISQKCRTRKAQSTNVSEPLLPDSEISNKKPDVFIFKNVSLTMMIT